MSDVDVLVAGAGPVGLTAACEPRRRGVRCRVIDRLTARRPFAEAVGVQPRTLEIWDRMGMVREALETAVPLKGRLLYANGGEQSRIELTLPADVPYGLDALPQYETERLLEELLTTCGDMWNAARSCLASNRTRPELSRPRPAGRRCVARPG